MKKIKINSRKTPLQSRSIERVERIIGVTEKLLIEDGLSKLTTSRIAEEACVPVGSIYQYFRDRDEILLTLGEQVLEYKDNVIASTFKDMAPHAHWRRLVGDMMQGFIEQVSKDKIHYKLDIALSGNSEWEMANLLSENRMVDLFAGYPRFKTIGYSNAQAQMVSRVIVVTVTAMINRSKMRNSNDNMPVLLAEAEKMVTAYLASIFGD